jgi:tetratricopeptide (TPR) repeat protein
VLEWLAPLLSDPVRAVRIAAARQLATVPVSLFLERQRELLDRGLEEFEQAQLASADRGGAHLVLSSLYQDLGDPDSAAKSLRTAIRLEPYLPHARRNLAVLLEQQDGDPVEIHKLREDEAEVLLKNVAMLPNNAELRADAAMALYSLDRLNEATAELEQACRIAPEQYFFRMLVTELYIKQARWEAAEPSARRLLELRPNDLQAIRMLNEIQQSKARGASAAE